MRKLRLPPFLALLAFVAPLVVAASSARAEEPTQARPQAPAAAPPTGEAPKPAAAKSAEAKPEQAKPEQAKPEQAKPEQAKPEQAKPEQAKPEQAKPEQAKPEQAKPAPPQVPAQQEAEGPAPSSPEAEAVWRAYEKRWSETEDYSAGFRQVIEVPDIGSRLESAGRFHFAKPGLVRWEYTEGPPQTVVGDGTWIWLYQPDLEQVYKIPYAKAFGRGGLVELLAGREGVSERYRASIEKPDAATVRILLKSLTEGGGDLEVTLEADTFDLRAVTANDAAGSSTQMIFAQPRRNRGVDRASFTFTPPPAVDIISDSDTGF